MPNNLRWVTAAIILVALLGSVWMLRGRTANAPPETRSIIPAHPPTFARHSSPRSRAALELPADSFDTPSHTAKGLAPAIQRGKEPAGSAFPANEPERPAPHAGGDGNTPGERPSAQTAEPPPDPTAETSASQGAALSVRFDGSARTAEQTEPIVAVGLEFDSSAGAARFPPGAVLAYPNSGGITPDEGTIAFWVRPEWDATEADVPAGPKALVGLRSGTWENRIELNMGPRSMSFLLTTSDGVEHGVGSPFDWAQGEWHNVACTWGQALMALYFDGQLMDQRTYDGTVEIPTGTPLYVASTRGSAGQEGTVWLRNFQVFQRLLTGDEITALVAQTVPPQ